MSRIYDLTLTAGGTQQLPAMGNKVKIYTAAYPVTVRTDGGEAFTLLEGQGVTLADGKTFRDVTVASTIAQTVQIFAGDARIEDSRVTGSVRVVDSAAEKTALKKQFYTGIGIGQWVAAVGYIWFRGLPGSRLSIKSIYLQSATAGVLGWGTATAGGTVFTTAGVYALGNKYVGAPDSTGSTVGYAYGSTTVYPPGSGELTGFVQRGTVSVPANTLIVMPFTTPFLVDSGNLLVFSTYTASRDMTVTVDAEEL